MIRLENLTAHRFRGWLHKTIASDNDFQGTIAGMPCITGEAIGLRGRRLHVLADLPPGKVVEAEPIPGAPPIQGLPPAPPPDLLGVPTVNGVQLQVVPSLTPPNPIAPNWVHFRARVSRMLVADLWVVRAPGQAWTPFRLILTASNPAVPDMGEVLAHDVELRWGSAAVQFFAGGVYVVAMTAGDSFGDGQARRFEGTIAWVDLMDAVQREAAWAFATGGVNVLDLGWQHRIGPLGQPAVAPLDWDPVLWRQSNYAGALGRMRTWQAGPLGIVARSGDSGEQEDQGFGGKGTAAFIGGGIGAARVLEFVASNWAKRPNHYREEDGSPLRLDIPNNENGLCIWGGRPIWWCRDQRGKPRDVSEADTHGWLGPDNQHDLMNTLGCAFQLDGGPDLQCLIDAHARIFLYSQTLDPRLATSMPDATRAWGWMGIVASWLWLTLEDRSIAQLVKDRFAARVRIYRQAAGPLADLVGVSPNETENGVLIGPAAQVWTDPNTPTPYPSFWLGYQQAVGAGGLQIAGEILDLPDARTLALEMALAVMRHCYQEDGTEWEMLGVDAQGLPLLPEAFVEGRGAHRSGDFVTAWFPFGLWVILRQEPTNARARFLWDRVHAIAANNRGTLGHPAPLLEWFPPLATA